MINMNFIKWVAATSVLTGALLTSSVQASNIDKLDDLLQKIESGKTEQSIIIEKRLAKFNSQKSQQEALLAKAKAELAAKQADSESLESAFSARETEIQKKQAQLTERLGTLKELLGVLGQGTGDMIGSVDSSPVSAQFPERRDFIVELGKKAGSSSELPSIDELERFWLEMQRELTHAGRVEQFSASFKNTSGETVEDTVTRVGRFNVIHDGKYLNWDSITQNLVEMPAQPSGSVASLAADLESAKGDGMAQFWLDPTGGALIRLLKDKATLGERVHQGGIVGYVILGLGAIGVLLAVFKFISLLITSNKVRQQMNTKKIQKDNNPLGRVMKVYKKHKNKDPETLELHLSEAIVSEVPKINRTIPWIKIISVVAPLLGLLGTVTGMINTFEVMSLHGTGDPKLMSGGISQALVTTVLGLVVAIPTLFLHAFVSGRAKRIVGMLEERAIGIMARHSERHAGFDVPETDVE